MATGEQENIISINIADEMRTAYIDYSMSVIVARALPDVRDGLKPVHRRVLFGMHELGVMSNKPFKKAARIVGEVLGKYHPHGDVSVYDAMVRMAQDWTLRYPLVQGQGNFGSIDGDSPAAMRYTEARLARTAEELLEDLNKDTVVFQTNFDDSLQEPTVLPAKLPNLLINGSSGIAVGMATNMPPHNLREVIDSIAAYIDDPEITIEGLMKYIQGPDFPTGGIIYGYQGIQEAYKTGRGRVLMRAKVIIEPMSTGNGREQIVVTEIPYMVNKSLLIEKTAQLVNDKKIEGISDIRDESDKDGLRIVYELKKDAIGQVVLNNLYKYTALQSTFGVNNVALVAGKPQTLNLKELVHHFVTHRHEVLVKKTQYELNQANKRLHILEGYLIALDNLDEIIKLIRASKDAEIAKQGLMRGYQLSEAQAKAILEMRLQRLTGMERDKITQEYEEVTQLISRLQEILSDKVLRMRLIKEDLLALKERYGDERRTLIEQDADEFTLEDMIPDEEMVISISSQGYIKRTPLTEYRTQIRGGVGARSTTTKEDDFITHLFVASTHHYLLIFTNRGEVYWKKVYTLPEGSKTAKGRAIQNLIPIAPGDQVQSIIKVKSLEDKAYVEKYYLLMCTKKGVIKKTPLSAYANPRTNGIHAIKINEGDELLEVKLTQGDNHVIMALRSGRAIHFHERDVRPMGRVAAGVRGVTLANADDRVVGMVAIYKPNTDLLVVAEKGVGKRSAVADYRITRRGGKGVKTLNITEKTGFLAAIKAVTDADDLLIINKSGIAIRISVSELRVMGRNTQGVRLIKLNAGDEIASVARIETTLVEPEDVEPGDVNPGELE
jgi:DNA gyrase subunit A